MADVSVNQLLAAFAQWKGYPLPPLNSDEQFSDANLHREWAAFLAGVSTGALLTRNMMAEIMGKNNNKAIH